MTAWSFYALGAAWAAYQCEDPAHVSDGLEGQL